ncbi:MAG: hypothetical protein QOF89_4459, partial [Acidobacteriota bacterium]|nr:hypothetical protein [Acidobacteriota bacterium]
MGRPFRPAGAVGYERCRPVES